MTLDCYCDYDDQPTFLSERIVKAARKEHRCYECRQSIPKGQPYEYVSGLWDGYFDTFKVCIACRDLRQWTRNNIPCFCWGYGDMLENAAEAISDALHRAPEETKGVKFGYLRLFYKVKRAPRVSA